MLVEHHKKYKNSFVVADDIEIGTNSRILPWLFVLLCSLIK